jgi:alpha-L-rhamnosidase
VKTHDLRTEKAVDPIGLGEVAPRLSWRLVADADETDVVQEAWQIEAGDGDDVVWDSGRVIDRTQLARYAGPPLGSRARRWWRVRAWTSAGETDWSDRAWFETGLLEPGDWSARMITAQSATPVASFTTSFEVHDDIDSARLYVTAHGLVDATINGDGVSDEVLAPGWTAYDDRLAVRTMDVTHLVHRGRNEIEALVAPGWFSGRFGFGEGKQVYGAHVGLFAQLEVRTADGATSVVATGPSWGASSTAFSEASIYDGETFDARIARDGAGSAAVELLHGFEVSELVAPAVAPVRRTGTLRPVRAHVIGGALQLDFGQNLVGWMRITVSGAPEGAEIVMRHAEVLGPDGRLYTEPLRSAKATDTYITAGDDLEIYEPRFTFHGFRYAEITGIAPERIDVEAVVVHSDLERTGTFTAGDELIDRLHANVVWGWRGNSVSVPTDCPQRDERLGWTGDAQVFSPTASFLYDCETFWENWLADLAADQREDGMVPPIIPDIKIGMGNGACGWGDAAVVIPWTTYEAYGDDTVIRNQLPSMIAWVDWVWSRLDDELRWAQDFQFGDWLDPDAPTEQPWRAKARFDLVATAYAAHSSDLLARMARIVGDDTAAARFGERFAEIREAWWTHYADDAAKTQTGCALGIEFGLAPSDDATQGLGDALARLVRDAGDHLATGFLGTPLLLPALTRSGHVDVAYDVLHQETPPGWLYTVKAGATTIWERWDALRPDGTIPTEALGTPGGSGGGMVSFNHYAYGCVADWMHRTVAGVAPDPDEPGFRHVIVSPKPGGRLRNVAASLESRYGHTATAWRIEDSRFTLDVTIPPNAHATVTLPDGSVSEMGSGSRSFECTYPA